MVTEYAGGIWATGNTSEWTDNGHTLILPSEVYGLKADGGFVLPSQQ
jgi:hypothetical protein